LHCGERLEKGVIPEVSDRESRWIGRARWAYHRRVDLRQLEAFLTVATELHFGRAAQKLHMSQPHLSEIVRRLESEVGTPLLTRTTRSVALTEAGVELVGRARGILEQVAAARAAVRRVADGEGGRVRLAIAPPVAPALAPHLAVALHDEAPQVELIIRRMWLPELKRAIPDGEADVVITCGRTPDPAGIISDVLCAEPLMIGVRRDHRLAGANAVRLEDLSKETLGLHSDALFPEWASALRQVLKAAGISPPIVELAGSDLSACRWSEQREVDWILTTAAISGVSTNTPLLPPSPPRYVPYTLQWCPLRASTVAVGRFVNLAFTVDPPQGWVREPH